MAEVFQKDTSVAIVFYFRVGKINAGASYSFAELDDILNLGQPLDS